MSIDATSVLLEAKELVERRGIGFAVVVTTRGVARALSVTGAGAFLTCHSSTDAAEHHGMPGTRP